MPQEYFPVSLVYPDVVAQNVQHLVDRVGDPGPETITSLARDANTSAVSANSAAQGLRGDFTAAIGHGGTIGRAAQNAHATWEKLEHVHFGDFATKEDINRLQCITLALWWLDHMCWYFFHQRAETAVHVACHHAGLGDPARRDRVTGEDLSRVAGQYHLPHPPPDELEHVLRAAKAFAANLPTPPTTTARSAKP
jgi:hypothetical protein